METTLTVLIRLYFPVCLRFIFQPVKSQISIINTQAVCVCSFVLFIHIYFCVTSKEGTSLNNLTNFRLTGVKCPEVEFHLTIITFYTALLHPIQ